MYEIFEQLLQKYGVSTYRVSKETGIAQSVFSSWKSGISKPKNDKMQKIADYFGVSLEYLVTGKEKEGGETYYLNEETASIAQEIFENKELKMLFDVSRNADAEDLKALHNMALALKRKERDNNDEGC
ncbi:helix-turn-helix transcriptional regulator [Lacrimispora sp. NSJ-141]|uniref:Helix-turn-helix transcriptional regulator n=1 Tax=Lientehia hominis TaxID=2897778 RepID=A0AAP2RKF6_9FIRM|nr:helix-turn-helix transcriptional regulator [Lientehia hominis]MCD2493311.1 helix-turn-helix transcriptional regulator [Lientehia hominis]